jgi:hypothetical protein
MKITDQALVMHLDLLNLNVRIQRRQIAAAPTLCLKSRLSEAEIIAEAEGRIDRSRARIARLEARLTLLRAA